MRKAVIITALAFMTMTVQAQILMNRLIGRYKHSPKAEYVHVPKMMMSFVRAITTSGTGDCLKYIKHINSIKVLDVGDCSEAVKQQFFKDVARLKIAGYEELMAAKKVGEQTIITVRKNKTRIKELVIIDSSDDDAALAQILGNIRNSEIQRILAEEKKK